MTTKEKFMAMEELWEDMSKNIDNDNFTPQWHLDTLDKREQKVKNGEALFHSLEDIKKEFRSLH